MLSLLSSSHLSLNIRVFIWHDCLMEDEGFTHNIEEDGTTKHWVRYSEGSKYNTNYKFHLYYHLMLKLFFEPILESYD